MLGLFIITITSCRKDLGNYNYQDINEGTITGIESTYSILRGQKLEINPTINFTKDDTNDTTKYTYKWFSIDPASSEKKNFANGKNLNWLVSLPAISNAYTIYYIVTEKSTGITFQKKFKLSVTSTIADGWLVLNNVDGISRLDFFNYNTTTTDFVYYNDILSSFGTLKPQGKPISLYYQSRRDVFTNVSARTVFLNTDQNTYVISTQDNTFNSYVNLSSIMGAYFTPPYHAEKIRTTVSSGTYMFDSNGQMLNEDATVGSSYGTRLNKLSNGTPFNISPFFAEGYRQTGNYMLMFDIDKKRFMEQKGANTSSSVPVPVVPVTTPATPPLFDPGNVGMDLMYMDYTPAISGQVFAILKNSSNKVYLARMVCSTASFTEVAFDEITLAPEMVNASNFAIDPVEGYIMYLVGSKVYRYNPFLKTNKMVVDLGTRKISVFKYQRMVVSPSNVRYAEYAKKLIIGSYDEANSATSGKVDLYNVPSLDGELSLYKSFSGLGKIVDIAYKE